VIGVRNILLPIDFSETSTDVLELGRRLADAFGASMYLLHVISASLTPAPALNEQWHDAINRLASLLNSTDRATRHARVFCEVGTPAHEIVRCAAEHAIDLIVMGTHWHGPSFQMATGSIAESVLGAAPCAVLAVKGSPEAHPAARHVVPASTTAE
jgi:nucleotide-binding universal stress UspA family protein